jgi:vacuolar-type H+-ATPase subunit I/STV1
MSEEHKKCGQCVHYPSGNDCPNPNWNALHIGCDKFKYTNPEQRIDGLYDLLEELQTQLQAKEKEIEELESLIGTEIRGLSAELTREKADNVRLKEAYNEIFERYIPVEQIDKANDELILLIEGKKEKMGRDLLTKP